MRLLRQKVAIGKWLVFAEKWKKVVPKVGNKNDLEVEGGGALQTIRPTSSLSLSQTQFLSLSLSHRFVSLSFSFFLSLSLPLSLCLSFSLTLFVCLSVCVSSPRSVLPQGVNIILPLSLSFSFNVVLSSLFLCYFIACKIHLFPHSLSLFHPKLFFSQSQVLSLSLTYSVQSSSDPCQPHNTYYANFLCSPLTLLPPLLSLSQSISVTRCWHEKYPKCFNIWPKISHCRFYLKSDLFKIAQKEIKCLATS